MTPGVDGDAAGSAGGLGIGGPEAHAPKGHLVQLRSGGAPVLAAALPAQLAPAHVVGENVDDVGRFAELLFEGCQLGVYGFIFRGPFDCITFLDCVEGSIELGGVGPGRQAHKQGSGRKKKGCQRGGDFRAHYLHEGASCRGKGSVHVRLRVAGPKTARTAPAPARTVFL